MPTKHKRGFAPSAGARLNYEIAGDGEQLVLVNAGIADSRTGDGQLAAITPRQPGDPLRYERVRQVGDGRRAFLSPNVESPQGVNRVVLEFLGGWESSAA